MPIEGVMTSRRKTTHTLEIDLTNSQIRQIIFDALAGPYPELKTMQWSVYITAGGGLLIPGNHHACCLVATRDEV